MLHVSLHHREDYSSEEASVHTPEEASAAVLAFQRARGMGVNDVGNFHGKVYVGGSLVYVVTYKGKVMGRSNGPDKTLFNVVVFDPATIK